MPFNFPHYVGVGDFMFCKDHGLEFCHRCTCDHRLCNNIRIEETLEELSELDEDDKMEILEEIDGKHRLFSVGSATPETAHLEEPTYKCHAHLEVDCVECFNFSELWLKVAWGHDVEAMRKASTPPSKAPITQTPLATAKTSEAIPQLDNSSSLLRPLGKGRLSAHHRPTRPTSNSGRRHVERPQMAVPSDPHRFVPPSESTKPLDLFVQKCDRSANRFRRYFHRNDDSTILAFTDGSCLDQGKSTRRARWGFVYNESDAGVSAPLEGTIGGKEQTSNRAELRAVIGFLQLRVWEAGGADRFVIATDSQYVVEGICGRLEKWISRGWRTAAGQLVANQDLWKVLKQEIDSCESVGIKVLFWRIPRQWNLKADALAKRGAEDARHFCTCMGFLVDLGPTAGPLSGTHITDGNDDVDFLCCVAPSVTSKF